MEWFQVGIASKVNHMDGDGVGSRTVKILRGTSQSRIATELGVGARCLETI